MNTKNKDRARICSKTKSLEWLLPFKRKILKEGEGGGGETKTKLKTTSTVYKESYLL